MDDKILSLLGFAQKAAMVVSGSEAVKEALSRHKVHLLFASRECSEQSLIKIGGDFPAEKICRLFTAEQLSHAIGKNNRHFLALTDRRMAEAVRAEIEKRR